MIYDQEAINAAETVSAMKWPVPTFMHQCQVGKHLHCAD